MRSTRRSTAMSRRVPRSRSASPPCTTAHSRPAASTDAARARLLENTLNVLDEYSPGIRGRITASQLLLPADLEREFRLTGGHWHHGELALDQMLMLRPVPGAAQYAMPVNGLY